MRRHILESKYPERCGTSAQFNILKLEKEQESYCRAASTWIVHGDGTQLLLTDFTDIRKSDEFLNICRSLLNEPLTLPFQ